MDRYLITKYLTNLMDLTSIVPNFAKKFVFFKVHYTVLLERLSSGRMLIVAVFEAIDVKSVNRFFATKTTS